MPRILATAIATPPHRLAQSEARDFARAYFGPSFANVERMLPVFEHAGIEGRDLCQPAEWFFEPRSFEEKNRECVKWAQRLGLEAAERCLVKAGVRAKDIGHLIFVSSTALATPSLDARILHRLGMSRHSRRTPLFGLGCAGGTAGLAHADRSARAAPAELVLLVAVETTSLTFLQADLGKSNLVATALFGDGAAAVIVAGDDVVTESGASIVATRSTLFEDSLELMGWNFRDEGMQVVFSRAIPGMVKNHARADVGTFLDENGLAMADIDCWVVHPGGVRVIEAYEEALELPDEALHETRAVLRDHGNMSSVTVLYVLERFVRGGRPRRGEHALLTALGPGFSSEHVLLRG